MEYPVYETFHSWQGEGAHLGKSAFFIRLFGCPVHCPWCDSAGTWHPDYVPSEISKRDADSLVEEAKKSNSEFVVVTGGEPCIHDLGPLTEAIRNAGLKCHLETSGAFEIKGVFDWVTLSPKWQALPVQSALDEADEFKVIVEDEGSIERWVEEIGARIGSRPVWLHPEWSRREDRSVLKAITEYVKAHGAPFRAGVQAHKYYKADLFDKNSVSATPLGGDPSLGY